MTNLTFEQLDANFRADDFTKIENDARGIRYLKTRSISRRQTLESFFTFYGIDIVNIPVKNLFKHLFGDESISDDMINIFLEFKYQEERAERILNQDYLIDQLNRLPYFDWGGSFGNSLEKNIVDNYVKKIQSFDQISDEIEGRLLHSLRGYTMNSWYNHWTSILIEDLFKDQAKVLPTVGLVKKIDFFINNVPFDLKVTYFPEQLMKDELRKCGFGNELTQIKRICRQLEIYIPTDLKDDALKLHLFNIISENQSNIAKEFVTLLKETKKTIITKAESDSSSLKKWFYENQGEARFDASNRFFLVLVDENDTKSSWKLKRNLKFLKEKITDHFDQLTNDMSNLEMSFYWSKDQKNYTCKSDLLFLKYSG